jgi:hypothetical protein
VLKARDGGAVEETTGEVDTGADWLGLSVDRLEMEVSTGGRLRASAARLQGREDKQALERRSTGCGEDAVVPLRNVDRTVARRMQGATAGWIWIVGLAREREREGEGPEPARKGGSTLAQAAVLAPKRSGRRRGARQGNFKLPSLPAG